MLIDSHAHLEMSEFRTDVDEVVKRAQAAGIEAIVCVGINLENSQKAVALANRNSLLYASVGVHPHDVRKINDSTYDKIKLLASDPRVVAYGEIGLDFFRNLSPTETQKKCFVEQMAIAAELGKPVIIHDRDAHNETLDILQASEHHFGGVLHCFSGDVAFAKKCLDLGFYISISGVVTFQKNEVLADVVKFLPIDRMLIETDCPYLTPHPHRGKRNEPAFVKLVAQKVAELRKTAFEEIAQAITSNAKALFNIP